jgi:myo-inositol-1(or 4)-monophosphatase
MLLNRIPIKSPFMNVMLGSILKASKGLLRDFGEVSQLQVSEKSLGNFVSSADLRIEKVLCAELNKARPSFGIISEEGGDISPCTDESESYWVIDPLDGTKNFLHGIPHFAISVALIVNQQVVAGITYDPTKDEVFAAEKGNGAFMNNKRLRVSSRQEISESLIASGPSLLHGNKQGAAFFDKISSSSFGFRRMGASTLDLAYVAAGRLDAFIETAPQNWDTAAGILMVQEAGGTVTQVDQRERTKLTSPLLASNGKVHGKLASLFT